MNNQIVLIKNGQIIDPQNRINKISDVEIKGGRIKDIRRNIKKENPDTAVIDGRGCWVVPGLFDMHVHLREPGQEEKETVSTGCGAALNGGFTGVACMPNTSPVIDNQEVVRFVQDRAASSQCSVHVVGSVTKNMDGETLSEIGEMKRAGAVAFSEDGKSIAHSQLMLNSLRYISMEGLPVICHCEDPTFNQGAMHEGSVSSNLGIKGIPSIVEELYIHRDIELAE